MNRSVAIVIPAFLEADYLGKTLTSIFESFSFAKQKNLLQVVLVVNQPIDANLETRKQSNEFLSHCNAFATSFPFPVTVLEKLHPGLRFGVGEARKIGMDWAVKNALKSPEDLIVSLDADTLVAENYLDVLWKRPLRGSGFVLDFEHRTTDRTLERPIRIYDEFLRHMQRGLQFAGSPFAYVSMGSALGTSCERYIQCGGMPAKNATEDFHFLNKLAKLGTIEKWTETKVFPSVRISNRVYLGTGFFLKSYVEDSSSAVASLFLPSQRAFEELKATLQRIEVADFDRLSPPALHFLHSQHLLSKLKQLRKRSRTLTAYQKRIPQLFDAIRTYRLLKKFDGHTEY